MTAIRAFEPLATITKLAESIAESAAVKNDFYDLWTTKPLSASQLELVAANYFARVRNTPRRIALAYLHMKDLAAQVETVENLSDEMGRGDASQAHVVLLRSFFEGLLARVRRCPNFDLTSLDHMILPDTRELASRSEDLFSDDDEHVVCGALLAQEWHAYPQLVRMYEGVRLYKHEYGYEEFHEQCEYFYLHIGATEKEHKVNSLATASRACRTEQDLDSIQRGFSTYRDLLAANWSELYRAVSQA